LNPIDFKVSENDFTSERLECSSIGFTHNRILMVLISLDFKNSKKEIVTPLLSLKTGLLNSILGYEEISTAEINSLSLFAFEV
jgi:hypothetical protein